MATILEVAERAWMIAVQGIDESALLIGHVEAMVPEAVQRLCEEIAYSPRFGLLQKAYSLTLASDSGTGLGKAAFASADSVMGDTASPARGGLVKLSGIDKPLEFYTEIQDLYWPKPGGDELGSYTVRGSNGSEWSIYAAKQDGTALTGSITVLACGYRTFATLPADLEEDLVMVLADMAKAKQTLQMKGTGPASSPQGEAA